MSANTGTVHTELSHDHFAHGHDDHSGGAAHGTRKSYMTGFILSVILTAIPFALVMGHWIADSRWATFVIMGFALVQVVVHMVLFLHMNTKSEGGWTMLAFIFTLIVLVISMTGSVWVMYHMNANMMPMTPAEMRNMP